MREWSWSLSSRIQRRTGYLQFDITSTDYLSPSRPDRPLDSDVFLLVGLASWSTQPTRENDLKARRLQYDVAFDIVTNQPAGGPPTFVLENLESQADWDLREAKFPRLVQLRRQAAKSGRIDELAQPRHLHTVDFPLWQRDPGKSKVIAELDSGSYFRLSVL